MEGAFSFYHSSSCPVILPMLRDSESFFYLCESDRAERRIADKPQRQNRVWIPVPTGMTFSR